MDITIMIGGLSGGGAERVVCNLSNYLGKNHTVTILTMSEDNPAYYLNEKIKRVSLYKKNEKNNFIIKNIKRFIRLKKYLKRNETDIYIVMLPVTISLLLSQRRLINVPIIVAERGDPSIIYNNSRIWKFIMNKLYGKADNYIFQTDEAEEFYKDKFNVDGKVIPNAINSEFIKPLYTGKKRKKIVSVGRFTKQKNFSMLIKAFYKINEDFPDYKLEIYGDGPLKNDLEKLIAKLGLQYKVSLPGYVKEIDKYIENAMLFVLPSNYEGMPNALMEAMALGLPVISTDCRVGGPGFLINNGENGLLVPVGNVEELAKSMELILSDLSLSKQIGNKAQTIVNKLNPNRIYKQWEEYIIKIYNLNNNEED